MQSTSHYTPVHSIPERLKTWRKHLSLSEVKLARILGVSESTVSHDKTHSAPELVVRDPIRYSNKLRPVSGVQSSGFSMFLATAVLFRYYFESYHPVLSLKLTTSEENLSKISRSFKQFFPASGKPMQTWCGNIKEGSSNFAHRYSPTHTKPRTRLRKSLLKPINPSANSEALLHFLPGFTASPPITVGIS